MKIDIRSIPINKSINIRESLNVKQIFDDESGVLELEVDFTVNFFDNNIILVNGKIIFLKQYSCDRCLGEYRIKDTLSFSEDYKIYNDTKFISLDEDIRNTVLESFPYKNLCSSDCKGLCPKCGTNLNIKKCDCKNEIFPNKLGIKKNKRFLG